MTSRRLAIALVLLASASCRAPADRGADPPQRPDLPRGAARTATIATTEEAARWPRRREWPADLDGDGAQERIVLAADAATRPDGRTLWEDGHRWAVLVEDGADRTLVHAAFVPHGFVEAAVLAPSAEGRRALLVLERTPLSLRTMRIDYEGPGRTRVAPASDHVIESWLPGSATLPD